jgi:hypothetical protein
LAAWSKTIEDGKPETRAVADARLEHSKVDGDLASVRDAESLAKLPEDERKAWRRFWADVDALLKRVWSH